MKNMFSIMMIMFAGIFWIVRVVISVCYSLGTDIGIVPLNNNIEVILLFITLLCMIFIIKRNIFGALIYFIANFLYFGDDLYIRIVNLINGQLGMMDYISFLLSALGIAIPFFIVMDILINKDGKSYDGKTDWFYKNQEYTRKLDERADKNQYKF